MTKLDIFDPEADPAAKGMDELREHWPMLADPVKAAVLTLVRSAAGISPADTLPVMLNVHDVARLMRISRATVDRKDAIGELPTPVKTGRFKTWERDGFLRWLRIRRPDGEPFNRNEWARLEQA